MVLKTDSSVSETGHQRGQAVRKRLDRWQFHLTDRLQRLQQVNRELDRLRDYLAVAPAVTDALQILSGELFARDLKLLEEKLTIALAEVLGQSIRFCAESGFKGNVTTMEFSIERDGNVEDIRRGQGGSVHNILSVGLRMFALTMLDENLHRRFLMLDEQDCWLHPDLVSRLVKIVHHAGRELGFQTIMISHHDVRRFEEYADRIYQFGCQAGEAVVTELRTAPLVLDN
jgi:DNA repair exonuclease SbcCD ATPase subunit